MREDVTRVNFTAIDGIHVTTIQRARTRTGFPMALWPNEHHVVFWLALSPGKETSGGKV